MIFELIIVCLLHDCLGLVISLDDLRVGSSSLRPVSESIFETREGLEIFIGSSLTISVAQTSGSPSPVSVTLPYAKLSSSSYSEIIPTLIETSSIESRIPESGGYFNTSSSESALLSLSLSLSSMLSMVSQSITSSKTSTLSSKSAPKSSLKSIIQSQSSSIMESPSHSPSPTQLKASNIINPANILPSTTLNLTLPKGVNRSTQKFQTNKFYTNILLESQNNTIWTYPYNLFYSSKGMAVSTVNISHRVFDNEEAPTTFSNPTMVAPIYIGSNSSRKTSLIVQDLLFMSATAKIATSSTDFIEFPLVQGMGMVTAIYHGSTAPQITCSPQCNDLQKLSPNSYTVSVEGVRWWIYVSGSSELVLENKDQITTTSRNVTLQIAILDTYSEKINESTIYSQCAGTYSTNVSFSRSTAANYSFKYTTNNGKNSLVYLLPHHLDIISDSTKQKAVKIELYSSTKGKMTSFLISSVDFSMPSVDLGFLPKKSAIYSSNETKILTVSILEELEYVKYDVKSLIQDTDTYTMGKILDKYSYMLIVSHMMLNNNSLTTSIFQSLQEAWKLVTSNKVKYPLSYLHDVGGVAVTVSNGECYSANLFNDHHFHYGYFIHSAAVMAQVSKDLKVNWLSDSIRNYVNLLVRDVANPLEMDPFFPQFRHYDWYHGHSFASGLIVSGDGRNQESSSEDYNFAYAMMLWGRVTGDSVVEDCATLMIATSSYSLNSYYYFTQSTDTDVIPANYVSHMVPGILYENKLTYVTFFGTESQYVHGIQMLPVTPASNLMKRRSYVKKEWESFQFDELVEDELSADPWGHILKLNQALFDPQSALAHFTDSKFDIAKLDNGQSLSWSLAFAISMTK